MKFDYKEVDGGYEDSEGCFHEDMESLIQTGIIGFCGCGAAWESLAYVKRSLELVKHVKEEIWDKFDSFSFMDKGKQDAYKKHEAIEKEHYGSEGAEYFMKYWMDNEGLTEHGSSVNGAWLEDDGYKLLELLEKWEIEFKKENTE
jgi:hypothetical protein